MASCSFWFKPSLLSSTESFYCCSFRVKSTLAGDVSANNCKASTLFPINSCGLGLVFFIFFCLVTFRSLLASLKLIFFLIESRFSESMFSLHSWFFSWWGSWSSEPGLTRDYRCLLSKLGDLFAFYWIGWIVFHLSITFVLLSSLETFSSDGESIMFFIRFSDIVRNSLTIVSSALRQLTSSVYLSTCLISSSDDYP